MVGAVREKLWKTGEDGLCCSSSAIQTRLGPSSLLEERSEIPIIFVVSFVLSATPPNWGKRPRYIDRQNHSTTQQLSLVKPRVGGFDPVGSYCYYETRKKSNCKLCASFQEE